MTCILAAGLERRGVSRVNKHYFDTLTLEVGGTQTAIIESAQAAQINLRILGRGQLGLSLDETSDETTVAKLFDVFLGASHGLNIDELDAEALASGIPDGLLRTSPYLRHPVFNAHHSETEMLRYLKQLENKDLALNLSLIHISEPTRPY